MDFFAFEMVYFLFLFIGEFSLYGMCECVDVCLVCGTRGWGFCEVLKNKMVKKKLKLNIL